MGFSVKPDQPVRSGNDLSDKRAFLAGVLYETGEKEQPGVFGDVPVSYIGRTEFVANKRASARKKDLADLEALGEE